MPEPRYVVPGDLLGAAEVVALLGVTKMTLSRWRRAGTFPEPFAELEMGPVWVRVDVETWAAKRNNGS